VKRVAILVLNWNNWADTLECLESLFHLDYPDFQVIVCDNGSTDDSLVKIREWAAGILTAPVGMSLSGVRVEFCQKPIPIAEFDRSSIERGDSTAEPLLLIRNGANLGFAGGNNVGLRYALQSGQFDYCWVLNNDTVVASDALQKLVDRMNEADAPGLCGSTLLEYRNPDRINALGGAFYSRWLGLAWHLGRGRRWPRQVKRQQVEHRMDYVVGASMFTSREFLETVGLMAEDYFLYYEELDWATRAHGYFACAWAPQSLVYHKIGGTIGTSSHPARKSLISDYYTLRNRIRFTLRFYPWALPTLYFGLLFAVGYRLLFGQGRRAAMVLRLMLLPGSSFEECCHE
jgi:GT2 family glycosyltransferase